MIYINSTSTNQYSFCLQILNNIYLMEMKKSLILSLIASERFVMTGPLTVNFLFIFTGNPRISLQTVNIMVMMVVNFYGQEGAIYS